MSWWRTRPFGIQALGWLIPTIAAAVIAPAIFGSPYDQTVLELAAVYVIAATGLNVAIGFSGQFQMAQPAMMAASAYTTAILTVDHAIPFVPAALGGLAASLLLGLIVALVSLRTRSHYLLLATFGVQLVAVQVITELHVTGGVNGHVAATGIPLGSTLLTSATADYSTLVIVVAGIGLWVAHCVRRSYLGLSFEAVRQNDRLVQSSGLSVGWQRFSAVLISSLYGGVAGILMGPVLTFLVPSTFGLDLTLLLLLIVVVGGMGSVLGVASAAVLLTIVSQEAQDSTPAWPLIYGLVIMVILVIAPSGLAGIIGRARAGLRSVRRRRAA